MHIMGKTPLTLFPCGSTFLLQQTLTYFFRISNPIFPSHFPRSEIVAAEEAGSALPSERGFCTMACLRVDISGLCWGCLMVGNNSSFVCQATAEPPSSRRAHKVGKHVTRQGPLNLSCLCLASAFLALFTPFGVRARREYGQRVFFRA